MKYLEHIFFNVIFALFILFLGTSYVRFMILHDYRVSYAITCNPKTDSCYIDCEDETCTQEYYYVVEKYAPDILEQCGMSVEGCRMAEKCQSSDTNCKVKYCEPETETCHTLVDKDVVSIDPEKL